MMKVLLGPLNYTPELYRMSHARPGHFVHAKGNLGLRIHRKRTDDSHDIETVLHTIDLWMKTEHHPSALLNCALDPGLGK
jgi:hypothetical protein